MRKVFLLFAVLGAFAVPASVLARGGGSWPMPGHDAQQSNFNATERVLTAQSVAGLHQVWSFPAQGPAGVIATGARVYALVPRGQTENVLVLNARTGAVDRWLSPAQLHLAAGEAPTALAYSHGKLIVGGGTRSTVAVDGASGRFLWRAGVPAQFLAVGGNTAYTGKGCQNSTSVCGALTSAAIDTNSGRVLWQHPGNGGGQPVTVAGRLYQLWGTEGGNTRVYDTRSGALLGTLPLDAAWVGDSANAYALDYGARGGSRAWLGRISPSGKPAWKTDLGRLSAFVAAPAIANGMLFVPSNRFHPGVVAIDATKGAIRWGANVGGISRLMVANGLLYALGATDGALIIINVANGHTVRTLPPPKVATAGGIHPPITGELVANGTVYLVGENAIVALRP
jgi:outer membrane protein assembly factor BamB